MTHWPLIMKQSLHGKPQAMFCRHNWCAGTGTATCFTDKFSIWMQWKHNFDGLMQERCNSIANALELHLSCTNPLIYCKLNCNKLYYLAQNSSRSVIFYDASRPQWVNTLRQRQNGRHFAYNILKCIFFNENAWILLMISLKFVPKVRINNIPALVQIMAWNKMACIFQTIFSNVYFFKDYLKFYWSELLILCHTWFSQCPPTQCVPENCPSDNNSELV